MLKRCFYRQATQLPCLAPVHRPMAFADKQLHALELETILGKMQDLIAKPVFQTGMEDFGRGLDGQVMDLLAPTRMGSQDQG